MASTRMKSRQKNVKISASSSFKHETIEENVGKKDMPVLCRCCLEDGDLKDMWSTYICENGEKESYGEMLSDCFSLAWQQSDDPEKICKTCINRLKDAMSFKKEILETGHLLFDHLEEETEKQTTEIKEEQQGETEEESQDMDQEYLNLKSENEEYEEWQPDTDNSESQDVECLEEDIPEYEIEDEPEEYLDIEYLEEDTGLAKTLEEPEEPKRKWPKKRKRGERTKIYKQYTDQELKKCIQAVQNNLMTRVEAAKHYNIPPKTLSAKLRAEQRASTKDSASDGEEKPKDNQSTERQYKFIEEIKLILTYTNATPYKTRQGRYYCAYCSTDGVIFEDPDELRFHTRTEHALEKLRGVDLFMRPHWLNEVVKLDIENLQCTVCCKPIDKWTDLLQHLEERHSVELSESYTRVIPYKLNNKLACALCDQKYTIYHVLDGHMNCHYSNYICGECGDTFLSESRLKKHLETHIVGKFPCKLCGKVFSLEKYRKKHFNGVHNTEAKVRCLYCNEKFKGEYARHLHVVQFHKEKVRKSTCELCNKDFDWRPYYLKHMRLSHGKKEKKHHCQLCDKSFMMKYELRNHEDWHNNESSFVCAVCNKKFSSKAYLQRHYATHLDDPSSTAVIVEAV